MKVKGLHLRKSSKKEKLLAHYKSFKDDKSDIRTKPTEVHPKEALTKEAPPDKAPCPKWLNYHREPEFQAHIRCQNAYHLRCQNVYND